MKKNIKVIFPLSIVLITVLAYVFITNNPPIVRKKPTKSISSLPVEIKQIKSTEFNIQINSYGLASAQTQTDILSQVSGKITYINEKFKDGRYFKKGELLLKIEDIEYLANIEIAKAAQALAQQELLEEKAKAIQALEDWQRFNKKEQPSDLVLRVPQLKYAKANYNSAKAQVKKAQLELSRTKIIAPYDGKVVQKDVSISQVLSNNSQIATIYATKSIKVRLPIKNSDLVFLKDKVDTNSSIKVLFTSSLSKDTYEGEIIASESSLDTNTKQLYLIAKIIRNTNTIKIGEYLKANIYAKKLKDVILVPNGSINQGEYVYIEKEGYVYRKEVEVSWSNEKYSLIKQGLKNKDNLVITSLGAISSGTKVKIVNTMAKDNTTVKKVRNKIDSNKRDRTK